MRADGARWAESAVKRGLRPAQGRALLWSAAQAPRPSSRPHTRTTTKHGTWAWAPHVIGRAARHARHCPPLPCQDHRRRSRAAAQQQREAAARDHRQQTTAVSQQPAASCASGRPPDGVRLCPQGRCVPVAARPPAASQSERPHPRPNPPTHTPTLPSHYAHSLRCCYRAAAGAAHRGAGWATSLHMGHPSGARTLTVALPRCRLGAKEA